MRSMRRKIHCITNVTHLLQRAVSILCDARLNRDYASKILQAISLTPNPHSLVLKYVRTAKPLLTEPDDINIYMIALAESSLFEAWQFQRTFSERDETRPRLFKRLLEWCITREYPMCFRNHCLSDFIDLPNSPSSSSGP